MWRCRLVRPLRRLLAIKQESSDSDLPFQWMIQLLQSLLILEAENGYKSEFRSYANSINQRKYLIQIINMSKTVSDRNKSRTVVLTMYCPDQRGIVSAVTRFLFY